MALITAYRFGPLTTYRLRRLYAEAPVASFSNSTGTVYPVIRRLSARGLIETSPVEGSRRGAETLMCTDLGARALKAWILTHGKEEIVLADLARSKLACFNLLTPQERLDWIGGLISQLDEAVGVLEKFQETWGHMPFSDLTYDSLTSTLETRRAWAERTRSAFARDVKARA